MLFFFFFSSRRRHTRSIIVKSPLLNAPRSLRKDRIIDFRQPPVIRIFESSNLKRESALGQGSVDSSEADVKLFARDRPLVCHAQAALLMREIDGILRKPYLCQDILKDS